VGVGEGTMNETALYKIGEGGNERDSFVQDRDEGAAMNETALCKIREGGNERDNLVQD